MEQQDLLLDIEQEISFEPASVGVRFANYIIDIIAYYILSLIYGLIYGLYLVKTGQVYYDEADAGSKIKNLLVAYIIIFCYYTLFEGLTRGKTLGKLITRTKVLREDGSQITFADAVKRSLGRIVPFEPFSAFGGNPWHDKWTKTMVIKQR